MNDWLGERLTKWKISHSEGLTDWIIDKVNNWLSEKSTERNWETGRTENSYSILFFWLKNYRIVKRTDFDHTIIEFWHLVFPFFRQSEFNFRSLKKGKAFHGFSLAEGKLMESRAITLTIFYISLYHFWMNWARKLGLVLN